MHRASHAARNSVRGVPSPQHVAVLQRAPTKCAATRTGAPRLARAGTFQLSRWKERVHGGRQRTSVPDLGLDRLGVYADGPGGELDTDGRLGLEVELVAGESREHCGRGTRVGARGNASAGGPRSVETSKDTHGYCREKPGRVQVSCSRARGRQRADLFPTPESPMRTTCGTPVSHRTRPAMDNRANLEKVVVAAVSLWTTSTRLGVTL